MTTLPRLRWVVSWDGLQSPDVCFASMLVATETGVIHASAEYWYEYYGEWYGGAFQRFALLNDKAGSRRPVGRPPQLPHDWPPANGYDAVEFIPKLVAIEPDGTTYTAHGDRIDAHDSCGRPLWSLTLDLSESQPDGEDEPAPSIDIRWLELARERLYILTAANTVACLALTH